MTGAEPPPRFDVHCPLLSLPRALRTTVESIPATVPYLKAEPRRVAQMAERFPVLAGPEIKVGLVWAGQSRHHDRAADQMDAQRSMRLSDFAPLKGRGTIRFVSLQKGEAARQVKSASRDLPLLDPMRHIEAFVDTAAVIAHLDLVISVDTAVAHLAGALGKPVWILSRFDGCWRWLRDRDDTPWYPTARLFRQTRPGDWSDVMARVATALAAFAAGRQL
ncbi:MAG: glycosyltransferase family 9 protein [Azospirillaceae bacterium]|nr:glycosyltransferase family 9 protein [Azospirillaceae bacterium]